MSIAWLEIADRDNRGGRRIEHHPLMHEMARVLYRENRRWARAQCADQEWRKDISGFLAMIGLFFPEDLPELKPPDALVDPHRRLLWAFVQMLHFPPHLHPKKFTDRDFLSPLWFHARQAMVDFQWMSPQQIIDMFQFTVPSTITTEHVIKVVKEDMRWTRPGNLRKWLPSSDLQAPGEPRDPTKFFQLAGTS